jgi:hypothetical protein
MRPIVHTFGTFLVERASSRSSSASATRTSGECWSGGGGSFDALAAAAPTRPRATSR